jgi:hypothetical protein
MNRSWRHDTAMVRGEEDGAPNMIGRGWKRVVDIICRKCRPISNMTSRGWGWCTGVANSGWASNRLRHLIPRSRKRLVLKRCRPKGSWCTPCPCPETWWFMPKWSEEVWTGIITEVCKETEVGYRIIQVRIYVAPCEGVP